MKLPNLRNDSKRIRSPVLLIDKSDVCNHLSTMPHIKLKNELRIKLIFHFKANFIVMLLSMLSISNTTYLMDHHNKYIFKLVNIPCAVLIA